MKNKEQMLKSWDEEIQNDPDFSEDLVEGFENRKPSKASETISDEEFDEWADNIQNILSSGVEVGKQVAEDIKQEHIPLENVSKLKGLAQNLQKEIGKFGGTSNQMLDGIADGIEKLEEQIKEKNDGKN